MPARNNKAESSNYFKQNTVGAQVRKISILPGITKEALTDKVTSDRSLLQIFVS